MKKLTSKVKVLLASAGTAAVLVMALFAFGAPSMHATEQYGPTRYEHGGSVIISSVALGKHEFRAGERIEIEPKLLNVGSESITIIHGDPAFFIDVYGPLGTKAWSYPYPLLDIGYIVNLEPGMSYGWEQDKIQERYDIRIGLPGEYRIVSHSRFIIEDPTEEDDPEEPGERKLEIGEVYSHPVTIRIVP